MIFARSKLKRGKAAAAAGEPATPPANAGATGTGKNSEADLLLADIALEGGTFLLQQGIQRGLLGRVLPQGKAARKARRRGLGSSLVHGAVLRLATRSVPGAILVGGGLLAKSLHDRRKAARARSQPAPAEPGGDDEGEEA